MKDKELILHIGHYKTGTSSIQNFMWDNDSENSRQGVQYLRTGIAKERFIGIRHFYLGVDLGTDRCLWGDAVKEITESKAQRFVVSCEGLIRKKPHEINFLYELLRELKVNIVLYLRRQDLFAESLYAEFVQNQSCSSSFEDFYKSNAFFLDYKGIVKRWAEAFGMSNLLLRDFADVVNHRQSVILDFLDICGLQIPSGFEDNRYRANPTMKSKELSIMLEINRCRLDLNTKRKIAQCLLDQSTMQSPVNSFFSREDRMKFLLQFRSDNEWLNELGLKSFDRNNWVESNFSQETQIA